MRRTNSIMDPFRNTDEVLGLTLNSRPKAEKFIAPRKIIDPNEFRLMFSDPFIGFDNLFSSIIDNFPIKSATENTSSSISVPSYPPYNIYKEENKIVIEVALAGFTKDDIKITLEDEKIIRIRSNKDRPNKDNTEKSYIAKRFANRDFDLKFAISNQISIGEPEMKDGVLIIPLEDNSYKNNSLQEIPIK